jgi:hypothetical protein
MDAAARKGISPNLAVRYAVGHLKDAEVDLLVAVRAGRQRGNSVLLAALVLLQEALAMLSRTATDHKSRRKAKTPHFPSTPGARFL